MAIGYKPGGMFSEINVTPLTDVFLVLLVIMILVAPLTNETVLKVSAPKVPGPTQDNPKKEEEAQIRVDVSASGSVSINGKEVQPVNTETIQRLITAEQSKAGKKDIVLNLSSEADARQKYVVAVMDAAAGAQIKQLRILALKR